MNGSTKIDPIRVPSVLLATGTREKRSGGGEEDCVRYYSMRPHTLLLPRRGGGRREMRGKGRRKDVSWGIKHRGGQRRRSVGRSVGRVLITLVHTRLALMTNVARGRARGCESPQWSGRGATPFHGGARRRKKRTCSKYMKHTTPVFKIATS